VLIQDLEDRVTYTSFLNGLRNGRFKFSLAERTETTLAEALRKAADFIHTIEICADNSDAPKKARIPGDKNLNRGDRNPSPEKGGRRLRQSTLSLLPSPKASAWRLGDISCSEGRHL